MSRVERLHQSGPAPSVKPVCELDLSTPKKKHRCERLLAMPLHGFYLTVLDVIAARIACTSAWRTLFHTGL